MTSPLTTWVRSVAIATIVTVLALAVLIVVAEETPVLKDWLKITFYHHWLGKGVLALGLFAVTSVVFGLKKSDRPQLSTVLLIESIAVIVSVCIIAGYFLLHALGVV